MKKEYIAPCSNVINVQTQHMMATSGAGERPSISVDGSEDNMIDAGASYSMKREDLWDNQW